VPAIDGETRSQTSTLSTESYNYDSIGRLTKVQETPAGQGCTTRAYAYDEESNRTGLATSGPGSEGKCSDEGAASERHLYDEVGRLIDPGTTYDSLGNATSLPGADAGGQPMTSTYYADNQVRTQTQNEETVTYSYDPSGRAREAVSSGKTSSTVVSHYSGAGTTPAWTSEGSETLKVGKKAEKKVETHVVRRTKRNGLPAESSAVTPK
jgi:YD repeat-containing protein